jgi:hypothetical protein
MLSLGTGLLFQVRAKLVSEAGFPQEQLIARNVHVEADQTRDHIRPRDQPTRSYQWDRKLVIDSVKKSLDHRAYRAGVAFAMQQIRWMHDR